jgi:hemolysin D
MPRDGVGPACLFDVHAGMPIAQLNRVAPSDPRKSAGKKTFIPLGATGTWRWAVCVAVGAVAASATIARQHIAADADVATPSQSQSQFGERYPGITRPHDVATIALPMPLIVQRVLVEVGDRVREGDPLLTLDDSEARLNVERLRLEAERAQSQTTQLEQAIARLDRSMRALLTPAAEANAQLAMAQRDVESVPNRQAKDSPERAQAAYDQATARARRMTSLAATGIVSRQEMEDAQIAERMAADDLAVARRAADAAASLAHAQALQVRAQANLTMAEQERQREERVGDLSLARLRQTEAQRALDVAVAHSADLTVRATGDSLVSEVLVKPGDRLLAGVPLVKLATMNPMLVEVDVPPAIVNGLSRGDVVLVRVGASATEYDGRIRTISPLPGEAGAHSVEVEFANSTSALLSGQTAYVRLKATR